MYNAVLINYIPDVILLDTIRYRTANRESWAIFRKITVINVHIVEKTKKANI